MLINAKLKLPKNPEKYTEKDLLFLAYNGHLCTVEQFGGIVTVLRNLYVTQFHKKEVKKVPTEKEICEEVLKVYPQFKKNRVDLSSYI